MARINELTTVGGILTAFGLSLVGLPLIVLQAYAQVVKDGVPHWFSFLILPLMLLGFVLAAAGSAITGVAARDKSDVPTIPQVAAATDEAKAVQKVEAAKIDPVTGGK